MKIKVDNRVRLRRDSISGVTAEQLLELFTHKNPLHGRLKAMKVKARVPKVDRSWRLRDGELSFPRGGLQRVLDVLSTEDDVDVEWDLTRGDDEFRGMIPEHRVELYPFQTEASEAAIAARTGVIRMPQGSGKTTTAVAIASRLNLPTLVIVWTSDLLEQWVERCVEELGMDAREVGIIRGSKNRIGPVTVAMQQSLVESRARELSRKFGVVIMDEAQRAAAKTFREVVDEFAAEWRIGITADERRADKREYLIYDAFGDVCAEASKAELERDGFILPVEVRVVESDFSADWYRDLEEPRDRATRLNELLDQMTSDEERNELVMDLAEICLDEGQVLALSHRREHCLLIDSIAASRGYAGGTLIGGDDYAVERRRAKKALKSGAARFAVGTYQAVGTGTDIPKVGRGVFATPSWNSADGRSQFGQFLGRYNRRGKTDAVVYCIWDRKVFGSKPLANLCRWCGKNVWVEAKGPIPKGAAIRLEGGRVWRPGREFLREVKREEQERSSEELDESFFERAER